MTDINWQALAEPFPKNEIKFKPGRMNNKTGKKSPDMAYITSRQVMNRLDRVLTPAGWRDEFTETPRGVVGTIYILINGEWVGKSDIGTESDIEEEKGIYSDAFKRAAVKWGIGRELYRDGTAFDAQPPTPPRNGKHTAADHWTQDPDTVRKFWAHCTDNLGLGKDDILGALKVERVSEFAGSKEDAIMLLDAYVLANTAPDPKAAS